MHITITDKQLAKAVKNLNCTFIDLAKLKCSILEVANTCLDTFVEQLISKVLEEKD